LSKLKVYFLNPPFLPHFGRSARWQDTGRGGTLYYPIWLSYCTALVEELYDVRLVDAPAWGWNRKVVVDDISTFKPDLLVMDTSYPSLENDIEVAAEIKKCCDTKIAMVGYPSAQFSDWILSGKAVDIVANYEYDFTIRDVAKAIDVGQDFSQIKGITYKANQEICRTQAREPTSSADLDSIPFVSKVYKKHLNIRDYFLGSSLYPEVQIFTGRGCPHFCTFCSWPQAFTGRKYRTRSISNVLDELEWIEKNLDVTEVAFEDDTFTLDRKRVLAFAAEYRKRGLSIVWSCQGRVETDFETLREMKKANCRLVIVGYESGSDEILKNIKKGTTIAQMRHFSKNAKEAGLLVHGDFVIGLPGENKATVEKTKAIIKELRPDILQVSVATPFPGTEFYDWVAKNNYLTAKTPSEYLDENGHQKSVVSYPWLTAEEISSEVDKILKNYYLSKDYVPVVLRQIFRKNGLSEFRRLWHSAKTFFGYLSKKNHY